MQLNPARGRKLEEYRKALKLSEKGWFMQLNPARGRKLATMSVVWLAINLWFMQLNPARGRKLLCHRCLLRYDYE